MISCFSFQFAVAHPRFNTGLSVLYTVIPQHKQYFSMCSGTPGKRLGGMDVKKLVEFASASMACCNKLKSCGL